MSISNRSLYSSDTRRTDYYGYNPSYKGSPPSERRIQPPPAQERQSSEPIKETRKRALSDVDEKVEAIKKRVATDEGQNATYDSHKMSASKGGHERQVTAQDYPHKGLQEASRSSLYPQTSGLGRPDKEYRKPSQSFSTSSSSTSSSSSSSSSSKKTFFLPMSGVVYLESIKKGEKTHEGRICRGTCSNMRKGDLLKLYDNRAKRGILCEITSWDRFSSFRNMLTEKGVLKMLPQLAEASKRKSTSELLEDGIRIYEAFPGAQDVKHLGVVAIGVKYIKDI